MCEVYAKAASTAAFRYPRCPSTHFYLNPKSNPSRFIYSRIVSKRIFGEWEEVKERENCHKTEFLHQMMLHSNLTGFISTRGSVYMSVNALCANDNNNFFLFNSLPYTPVFQYSLVDFHYYIQSDVNSQCLSLTL